MNTIQTFNCAATACEGFGPWVVLATYGGSAWVKDQSQDVFRSVDLDDLMDVNSGRPFPRSCGDGGE
jgi:hypothetical protein